MSESITFHVVPWFNSAEWHEVYNNLTDVGFRSKEEALKIILVWKARCPALPSGVESTLGLLQVYIEDKKSNIGGQEGNDQLLRLAYSTAIMRFVNVMLDSEIEKGTSLYKAAKKLGVPDWIVELRHDTAHSNNLPPITLLRDACSMALQWLLEMYWNKHKPYIKDYISGQTDSFYGDGTVTALMNSCISLGICSLPNLNIKTLSEIPDDGMRESLVNDTKELFGDLVDLSNLGAVPITTLISLINLHSKRLLLQVNDASALINEVLLGEDSLFLSRELLYFFSASDFRYKNKLYKSYLQCFELLLTVLHTNDLLLNFLLGLIKVTQTSGYFKARLAALWCCEILAALKNSRKFLIKFKRMQVECDTSKKTLIKLYKLWFPEEQPDLTLNLLKDAPKELLNIGFIQPIIAEYNHHLVYYIKELLGLLEPSLPPEVAERVCALTKLISNPGKFPMCRSKLIYTAEDILETYEDVIIENDLLVTENQQQQNGKSNINSIWKLTSREYNWNKIPIGQVPTVSVQEKPN